METGGAPAEELSPGPRCFVSGGALRERAARGNRTRHEILDIAARWPAGNSVRLDEHHAATLVATQLIFRFNLSGPVVPYHSKKPIPLFPIMEEDIY